MAYDEGLAERLYNHFEDRKDVEVKKMFGGLCFMVSNHMCCGIVGDTLMARVGPDSYNECLTEKHARVMDFNGKAMRGMVYVAPEGIKEDTELGRWIDMCESYVKSLPTKH
jgi:TfoX/Sxy family transcriptional regulator of competence genes